MTKSQMKKIRRLRFEVNTLIESKENIKLLAERYGSGELPQSYYKYCVKLDVKIMELMDGIYKLREDIERLENPIHRELLQLYYVEGLKWEEVAERMGYSLCSVYRIHKFALNKIREA